MAETVGVVIATYGDASWGVLAQRALASVERQSRPPDRIVLIHLKDGTLAQARNQGADAAGTDWLIFLDGDDELDSRYIEAMVGGTADLRQPATLWVVDGREDAAPVLIPAKPLLTGNYLVIGTMVRSDLFCRVGKFQELMIYDDWDLWIRCWLEGAIIESIPEAIYRVHVSPNSRNNQSRNIQVQYYNEIRNKYLSVARERGLR